MSRKDELNDLRRFLRALESGDMKIKENGKDVTQREIDWLKPDIEYLESVLLREPGTLRMPGQNKPSKPRSGVMDRRAGS